IVQIPVAGGAKRFVIETRAANQFFQLSAEALDRLQLLGGCGQLELLSGDKFLIPAIEQSRYFAVDQRPGAAQELRAGIPPRQHSTRTKLAHQDATRWIVQVIGLKSMIAKCFDELVKSRMVAFLLHHPSSRLRG